MTKSPRISVVMSVYNGEKYLKEAIESILDQTFTDFEFIIVNDGSTDNSLVIIQSYNDNRIKVINNEGNIGLTKSLNKAILEARGEYIARQDADDISLPNRFEEQIKYFQKATEVSVLGTSVYRIDEHGKVVGKYTALVRPSKSLLKGNQLNHGSVMFKKEVIDDLGGYNEGFRYGQDYELWLRVAEHFGVRNLTQILYKLRSHSDTIGLTKREESVLYGLLALKLRRKEIDGETLEAVRDRGIRSLYIHLDKEERICFHKQVADMYVRTSNLKLARGEYKNVFRLDPLNIENNVNIIRSHLGRSVTSGASRIYASFINLSRYLRNHLVK